MQQEFFGNNSITQLHNICTQSNLQNIFLVTGKKSFFLSGAKEKIMPQLKAKKITHFTTVGNESDYENITKGITEFKKSNYDVVIAVGGGRVIDIGKAINVLAFQNDDPKRYIKGTKDLETNGRPLIAIPLTAGTGSESTHFATIYLNKTKHSLSHPQYILPTIALVDPTLTESMPPYLTAVTGFDALSQAIESYWAVHATPESQTYAQEAITLAFHSIEKAVKHPDNKVRTKMAKAAHLSGKAINISKTTACHSISYPITAYYSIPHGHAVALTLPDILEYNYQVTKKDCNDPRGTEYVKKQLNKLLTLLNCPDEIEAKHTLQTLMKKVHLETQLSNLNIDNTGRDLILNQGFTPDRMSNNPRKITPEHLNTILQGIQ